MTNEQYSKAIEIRNLIDNLYSLEGVFKNGGIEQFSRIAAVKGDKKEPCGFDVTECTNYAKLTPELQEKFLQLVLEERRKLEKEFSEL